VGKNFEVGGVIYSLLLVGNIFQEILVNDKQLKGIYPVTRPGFELLIYRICI
jgi:hypothetical protein